MDAWLIVVIVAAVAAVALVAWTMQRRRRTQRLRDQFGPEYERTAAGRGRRGAEKELEERRERRERIELRELSLEERDRFSTSWRQVQAEFVDSPGSAARNADGLVKDVMRTRGYPVEDFEQRAADVSVDHPELVQDYRAAHRIAQKHSRGEASTEDLRQAMVHYRSLFSELLGEEGPGRTGRFDRDLDRERDREETGRPSI